MIWRILVIRQNCLETCRAIRILSAAKILLRERSFGQCKLYVDFAGVRWRGSVKWECGRWKWRFSLLSFTLLRTFYIHGHTTAFTWCNCRWHWRYFKVMFHIKFLVNGVWYGKSYCILLIGNYTLAFDRYHVLWPSKTFEGHFSQAFASRGL